MYKGKHLLLTTPTQRWMVEPQTIHTRSYAVSRGLYWTHAIHTLWRTQLWHAEDSAQPGQPLAQREPYVWQALPDAILKRIRPSAVSRMLEAWVSTAALHHRLHTCKHIHLHLPWHKCNARYQHGTRWPAHMHYHNFRTLMLVYSPRAVHVCMCSVKYEVCQIMQLMTTAVLHST